MIDGSILAGNEWNDDSISWRHYTQTTTTTSSTDIEEDDGDYNPSETKNARNLVLETTNGSLITYLDKYEAMSQRHSYHRNLVSTG